MRKKDPTAHAEINAIRKACDKEDTYNLKGCTIYCSCEPCPMCLSAIYWAKINRIIYAADKSMASEAGFDDKTILKELNKVPKQRKIEMKQIKTKSAFEVFKKWSNNPDKIMY